MNYEQGRNLAVRQELGIRCLDVLGASAGLLLALPLLAVVAVFVRVSSPGPVFCRQVYAGVDRRRRQRRIMNLPLAADRRQPEKRKKDLHGKPFTVYRFRTTHCGAAREELATLPFASELYTTSIGRRLRGWRLDELPILWNVLRGEMSLVGPRPEPPGLTGKRANARIDYRKRQCVKPGLIGLAQLCASPGYTPAETARRIDLDLYYATHRDWRLYLRILAAAACRVVGSDRHELLANTANPLRLCRPQESRQLVVEKKK